MTNKKEESYFYMWRSIIAMSNIDGLVSPEEQVFIEDFLKKDLITQEQKDIIRKDMTENHHPKDFIDMVNHPAHLSQLHHLACILFNLDGLDQKEKMYAQDIQDLIVKKVDFLGATRLFQENNAIYEKEQAQRKESPRHAFMDFINKFF